MAGMGLLTSLPWFASYLMPDLYAGLMILAVALAAFAWRRSDPGRAERGAGSVSAVDHLPHTHLLLPWRCCRWRCCCRLPVRRRAPRALGLPCRSWPRSSCCSAASWLGFGRLTLTPQGAPFLLARSWEDGPARAYLEAACPAAGWAICAAARPPGGHRAGIPVACGRQLLEHGSADPGRRAGGGDGHPATGAGARSRGAGSGRAGQWPLQLGQLGLDDFVLGRGAAVTPEDYRFVYLPLGAGSGLGAGLVQRHHLPDRGCGLALAARLGRAVPAHRR